ncbi:MAG TPA: hypothetical protein VI387_00850 [Candidatus Brocadiales bacterium]|nr:hypothetical protein [Candidatus Brocadiales bacterium]
MKVSVEQLEKWRNEARIYKGKLKEIDEMISKKLVGKELGARMKLVAEDDLEILISKLKNAFEDAGAAELNVIIEKAKTHAPIQEIKQDLKEIAKSKGLAQPVLELIEKHENDPLDLIIKMAEEVLKGL